MALIGDFDGVEDVGSGLSAGGRTTAAANGGNESGDHEGVPEAHGGVLDDAVGLGTGVFDATRLLRGFLFEVQPLDPLTIAVGGIAWAGVALPACWLPVRRAGRVGPMTAPRTE